LLAAEGLLGHQHANSGWGTFVDDNRVGATAFMETLEPKDAVGAVKPSILQWKFIDEVAGRIDDAALRQAQQAKDAVRAYQLV